VSMAPRKKASAAEAASKLRSGQHVQSLGAFKFGGNRLATGAASSTSTSTLDAGAGAYAYDTPQHLRVYLQHIGKTDPRTREKAMRGLTEYLAGSPSDEDVQALLTYWSKQLPKLTLSTAACQLTLVLCRCAGRRVGRVIQAIFPPLYFGQFTQDAALSGAASEALRGMLGDKMDAAVCEVCFDGLVDAIEAGGSSGASSLSSSAYTIYQLLDGAGDILDRLKATGKDPARMLAVMQGMEVKAWLRSPDVDVRRHAYSACTSLSAFSSSLDASFVRTVYGCIQMETEATNYTGLMTMVLAFGRDVGTWAAIRDPERDFHRPLRRIAASIAESEGLSKCFLPLLAVTPRDLWADGRLAELLLAMVRAPKEAGETTEATDAICECLQYVSANGMVPLVVDHVDMFAAEDALRRLGPFLAAMDAACGSTGAFAGFQVELLKLSLAMPVSFWTSGNVSFAYKISKNVGWHGLEAAKATGGAEGSLNDRLFVRLVDRAAGSGFGPEASMVETMSRIVAGKVAAASTGCADEFDRIIEELATRVGDRAAARVVDGVPSSDAVRSSLLPSVAAKAAKAVSTGEDGRIGDAGALALSKSLVRFSSGDRLKACLDDCVGLASSQSSKPSEAAPVRRMVLDLMAEVSRWNAPVLSSDSLLSFVFHVVWDDPDDPATLSAAEAVFRSQDDLSALGRLLDGGSLGDEISTSNDEVELSHRLYRAIGFCVASAKPGREVAAFVGFAETLEHFPDVAIAVVAHQSTAFFAELVGADVDVVLNALRRGSFASTADAEECEELLDLASASPASYVAILDRALSVMDRAREGDAAHGGRDLAVVVKLIDRGIHLDETVEWCRSTLFAVYSLREPWSASRIAALEVAVSRVRSDPTRFERSELAAFTKAVLRAETDDVATSETSATGRVLCACFPDCWDDERDAVDDVVVDAAGEDHHHPRRSVHNNGLICWDELRPNMTVWYEGAASRGVGRGGGHDDDEGAPTAPTTTATKATIVSRDDSIQPPSFVVDLGDGVVRETEASRLRLARAGPLLLGPPGAVRRPLVDSSEIDEAIRVIETVIGGHDSSSLSLASNADSHTLPALAVLRSLRALGAHGWDRLGRSPDARTAALELVLTRAVHAAAEMDALVASMSERIVEQANASTGAAFGEPAEALDLLATVRGNEVLCRAPTMVQLHERLRADLGDAISSFVEAHGEAVAASVRVFFWDIWDAAQHREAGDRLASSILSVFYGIGWTLAASRSVFAAPIDVWDRPEVGSMLRSLAAGVRAVDARRPDALDVSHGASTSSLPSQILSMCLNAGMSRPLAAAAFAVLLRRPDELAAAWSTDPDTFFGDVADMDDAAEDGDGDGDGDCSHGHDVHDGEMALPSTRPRDRMVDLNPLVRAAIEGGDVTPDFQTAWMVLAAYLASPGIEQAQQELLVLALKDAGVASVALSRTLVELLSTGTGSPNKISAPSIDASGGSFRHEDLLRYLRHGSLDVPPDVRMLFLMSTLPVATRAWYIDDIKIRQHKSSIEEFVKRNVSPLLIRREIESLERESTSTLNSTSPDEPDAGGEFSVKVTGNNVVASLAVEDGQSIDLRVVFPSLYPLKAGSATLERTPGISEERARRWQMSVELVLRNRSGDVSDAIKLWRRSVSGVFKDMECCLICYALIDPVSGALPRKKCRTCGIRLHASCLIKWCSSSGKSECVHCRSPW